MKDSITLEKIMKAKREIGAMNGNCITDPLGSLGTIAGMKIIEKRPAQKIKLSANVVVSDKFRQEYDAWLLNMFDYQESMMKPDECYMFNGMIVMRPEMAVLVRDFIA